MGFWDAIKPGSTKKAIEDLEEYLEEQEDVAAAKGRKDGKRAIEVDPVQLDSYIGLLRSGKSALSKLNTPPNIFDARIIADAGASDLVAAGYGVMNEAATALDTAANRTLSVYQSFRTVESTEFDGAPGVSMLKWQKALDAQYSELKKINPVLTWKDGASAVSIAKGMEEIDRLRRRVLDEMLFEAITARWTRGGGWKPTSPAEWNKKMQELGFTKNEAQKLRSLMREQAQADFSLKRRPRDGRYAKILDDFIHDLGMQPHSRARAAQMMQAVRDDSMARGLIDKFKLGTTFEERFARLASRSRVPGVATVGKAVRAYAGRAGQLAAAGVGKVPKVGPMIVKMPGGKKFKFVAGKGFVVLDAYALYTGIDNWDSANGWSRTSTVLTGASLASTVAAGAATAGIITAPLDVVLVPVAVVTGVGALITGLAGSWEDHREDTAVKEYLKAHKKEIQENMEQAYLEAAYKAMEKQDKKTIEEYFEKAGSRPATIVRGAAA